ncbi:glycosyltransferase [Nonomuraea sp. NPDC004580]|uniref:glycosyltransferase n=1 Tax=Nonomuraea sp. NPDC004580 TaxID=3154552 RepID=UPI0033A952A5
MDTRTALEPSPLLLDPAPSLASVDIVIPVLNEERALPGCVRTLLHRLDGFPLPWRVTIVDNGSTDATWRVAGALAGEFAEVHARRIQVRGRGAALRAAWQASPADIVAYMDVDLSTDLDALFPLLAAVASGHSEIAIGTRLAHGSRTRRSLRREIVSRGYNALLRYGFGARFSDAQCGFKAVRADVARPLLARVEDDSWFFDTELLLLAEHNGLRVHEVPVDWIEDADSRVQVVRTAIDDLRGLARVARTMARGGARVEVARREPAPAHPDPVLSPRMVTSAAITSFAAIGTVSAVLYALLYLPLRALWPPVPANLGALVLTCLCTLAANRRWAPGLRAAMRLRAPALVLATYVLTTLAVLTVPPWAGLAAEVSAIVTTYCLLTLLRFAALDRLVLARTRN